jgi:desulfoferrodoxin-like iron-binding protein
MSKKSEVYKCGNCGCIVSVITGGEGKLDCCGQHMVEVTPNEAKKFIYGITRPGAP